MSLFSENNANNSIRTIHVVQSKELALFYIQFSFRSFIYDQFCSFTSLFKCLLSIDFH